MLVERFLFIVFTILVVFNVGVFLFFRFFVKDELAVSKNDRRKKRESASVSSELEREAGAGAASS